MATLSKSGDSWVIQFKGTDKKRKTLRFSGMTRKEAEAFRTKVEVLVARLNGGVDDPGLVEWEKKLGGELHAKLAAAELVAPRETASMPAHRILGPFLDGFIAGKRRLAESGKMKPGTIANFEHAAKYLK